MKNKKGFTLVELLAVIVILGVLFITANVAVSSAKKQSKKRLKCKVVKEVATLYKSHSYVNNRNSSSCAYDNPDTNHKEDKCTFNELISEEKILDAQITSPITGEEIGTEKDQLYVTSGGCDTHILYTDKNGISICYNGTLDLEKNNVADLAEFCK